MPKMKLRDKLELFVAWDAMCSVCRHFAKMAHEDMGKPLVREDMLCNDSYHAVRRYRARQRYRRNKEMKNASNKTSETR